MKKFSIDSLETALDFNINSEIMEKASNISEKITELECKLANIECYEEDEEGGLSYTEDAQEIFNVHYDNYVDELYELLNYQLGLIEKAK